VVAKKGTPLQVRLNDPGKLLDSRAAPKQVAPHVLLGVFTPQHVFEPLPLASKDSNGRNHLGTVPLNTLVSLYITGRGVQITDETAAMVGPAGATIAVRQDKGDPPRVITFNITKP
jgi:hypothetical protein